MILKKKYYAWQKRKSTAITSLYIDYRTQINSNTPPPSPQQPNGTKLKLFHFSTTQSKNKTNLKKKTYTYISQIGNLPEIPLCKKKWTFLLCGSSAWAMVKYFDFGFCLTFFFFFFGVCEFCLEFGGVWSWSWSWSWEFRKSRSGECKVFIEKEEGANNSNVVREITVTASDGRYCTASAGEQVGVWRSHSHARLTAEPPTTR